MSKKNEIDYNAFAHIFSIPVKRKNTRFAKLISLALENNLLLDKECGKYILDDNNGSEWVCSTLNEVEQIIEMEAR